MHHATPSEAEVATTLSQLKLSTKSPQKPAIKPKSAPVAESWDDDFSGSGSDTETEEPSSNSRSDRSKDRDSLSPLTTTTSVGAPVPPPPTPASPEGVPFEFPDNSPYGLAGSGANSRDGSRRGSGTASPARRPDKTTAVAGRMIAAGLGVRAPRRTEEEREYDRAMREKERKRRAEEREREKKESQAAEERKRSVWED